MFGTLKDLKGQIIYEGLFDLGKKQGFGIKYEYDANKKVYLGQFDQDQLHGLVIIKTINE